ncbi:MAG: hypothetical protein K0R71_22 [Bacillales bacterium]|jgi:uncharacterized protein YlaI|nr:hypothetical protein [Bacillales bacterium]
MRAKCCLCDTIDTLDDDTLIAKQLLNRPVHTYMCKSCSERITEKTNARVATGKFKLFHQTKKIETSKQ